LLLPSVFPPEAFIIPTDTGQAAIVAQIAITGLSLNNLSQTHWVAKGSFVLSMTFALMAVYYATTQQRTLGRLIKAKDVRLWIRGGNRQSEVGRLVPSLHDIVIKFRGYLQARFDIASEQPREGPRVQISIFSLFWLPSAIWEDQIRADRQPRSTLQLRFDFVSSDPDDFTPDLSNIKDVKGSIMYHCFTPSVASVVTISAPQMLLSSSLALVLIALGIYFCSVWTLNLDQTVEPNDNRKVFITYLVGLGIAGLAYSISQLFQNDDKRSERQIVEGYLDEYLASHPEAVARWGLDSTHIDNGISLAQIEREGRLHDAEAQHSQRPLVEE
jgi:hypothetical protein